MKLVASFFLHYLLRECWFNQLLQPCKSHHEPKNQPDIAGRRRTGPFDPFITKVRSSILFSTLENAGGFHVRRWWSEASDLVRHVKLLRLIKYLSIPKTRIGTSLTFIDHVSFSAIQPFTFFGWIMVDSKLGHGEKMREVNSVFPFPMFTGFIH